MSEFYSPKAKPSQYSRPHFERPASVHQISTGYNGNNAFDYQDPTTKEKNRLRPPSQGSNDVTMKYWTTKEPDYLSEKELVPQTINIQPCNRPLIDKEEPYEGRPKQSQRQERTHSGRSHQSDKGFESGQQSGNRRHQSSNYGIRDQAEPKSAMSKIGENPKSIEKKIVFDLSSQTSHPTRDHISPDSVRYTKMSEDEAAHAFETRRKALIDNLLKRAEKAAEKPEGRMGEVHPHEIEKKKEENIKSPSSVSVKNKTNLRQAPVPMKSLGAELARAKQKSYAKNAQACSSKLKINEEATSIGSSAIVTPKSESVDFENTLPRKNNLIHKAMSPVRNSDAKIQKSPQRSSYASPELAKKKKNNEDENTVQLKNIFMKKPSVPDQQIYSKVVEEEKRYHADDEHAREQGFLNPIMANENKQRLNKEAYDREDTEHFGHRNIRNRAQTEAPNEKSKVQEESSLDNKNDIKSKFIRRKRKVSNEVDNQETRNEEDFFPTETEIIPYSSLNEKGFESHHQYLHERALLQKRNRDIAHQQSKQQNDQKEVQRCTFRPTIGSPPKLRENIIEKTKKWQISREQQIAQNKVDAMEKELVECTFYPNRTLANLDSNPRNFGDFLKRNAEWNQKRTEENKRKEEELFQKSHTSSIRSSHYKSPPRETPTTKRSCCHEKELALSKPVSVKNKHPNRGFKSPPKNQEIRACQHHEKENLHSHKPTERLTTVINDLDAIQETQQDLKTTLQMATQHFDDKIEDIPQVQDDISQSYGIIQNLKNVVSEKECIKKSKEEKRKIDIDLLLKTTGERFLRESGSLERIHQHESNRKSRRSWKNQRNSASPSKINDSLFKEVPVTSIEYDADIFQGNTYKVMLKKNKYYVSQRSELHSELKNIVEANSSPGLKVSDFLGEGDNAAKTKGILVQRKSRESSAKKTKTVTISPDDQNQRVSYFPTKEPEQRSFQYVTSEVMNNIEPQPTLHQRYADIINQASQIFTQLGQTSYQTYMSDWNA